MSTTTTDHAAKLRAMADEQDALAERGEATIDAAGRDAMRAGARLLEAGDELIPRDAIVEALRDAHANDSAANAVEYVSDLVGWEADEDDDEPERAPDEDDMDAAGR